MQNQFRSLALVALWGNFIMLSAADAFSVAPDRKMRNAERPSSTSAIGYSMQMPDFASGFPKTTWYDVVDPTARRIVYEDGPSDVVMFATIGTNWLELNDDLEDEKDEKDEKPEPTPTEARRRPWSRMNPIRPVRNLIRRIL